LSCAELRQAIPRVQILQHTYFRKRALEAARGAAFVDIPRFCNLIIVRVSSIMLVGDF